MSKSHIGLSKVMMLYPVLTSHNSIDLADHKPPHKIHLVKQFPDYSERGQSHPLL